MSAAPVDSPGLGSGRNWAAFPASEGPLSWGLDSGLDFLKGPLSLAAYRGQRVAVYLEEGQLGFLASGPDLQAIYLDGGHYLDVGKMPGQIHPDSQVYLLAADRPVVLRWTDKRPLVLDHVPGPGIIGNCTLQITGPGKFFNTFLSHGFDGDEVDLAAALDRAARQALADLAGTASVLGSPDPATLQSTLTRLEAADLNEDLVECGLTCTQLAVYTASPPVEMGLDSGSGQFSELVHT